MDSCVINLFSRRNYIIRTHVFNAPCQYLNSFTHRRIQRGIPLHTCSFQVCPCEVINLRHGLIFTKLRWIASHLTALTSRLATPMVSYCSVCNLVAMHQAFSSWHYKSKCFPCYWTFVRGIHRSPVVSIRKGQDRRLWYFVVCMLIKLISLARVPLY